MKAWLTITLLCLPSLASAASSWINEYSADLRAGALWQKNPPTEFTRSGLPPFIPASKQAYYLWNEGYALAYDIRLLGSIGLPAWLLKYNYALSLQRRFRIDPLLAAPAAQHRWQVMRSINKFSGNDGHSDVEEGQFDQLFLQARPAERLEFSLGRQPLNFASNFYFSPNDLFSPFEASDFLRLYKSGVDALRLSLSLSTLAQFELIAVMGYGPPLRFGNFDKDDVLEQPAWILPSQRKAALLGRSHFDLGAWAVSTLFGWKADRDIVGGSLEHDLGHGMMAIFEGNVSRFDDDPGANWFDVSLGLQAQINADWSLRAELASSPSFPVDPFPVMLPKREQRSLAALGIDWQAASLLKCGVLGLMDMDRSEGLATAHAQVSLSDNLDLILNFQVPWRIPGRDFKTTTAFELAPLSAGLQIRWVI